MIVVVQMLVVVALVTLIKLGTRRLFRGRARDQHELDGAATIEPTVDAAPRAKPKPTSRTNAPRRR